MNVNIDQLSKSFGTRLRRIQALDQVTLQINPGKVFDLTLPLEQVAEGYRAMDERRAIKALLRP
jgi:threonine dehydrogenase-like Zn-dependent dehydrogenase